MLRRLCHAYLSNALSHLSDADFAARALLHDNASNNPMQTSQSKVTNTNLSNHRSILFCHIHIDVSGDDLARVVIFAYRLCASWHVVGKNDDAFLNPNNDATPSSILPSSSSSSSNTASVASVVTNIDTNSDDEDDADDIGVVSSSSSSSSPPTMSGVTSAESDARIAAARGAFLRQLQLQFNNVVTASDSDDDDDSKRLVAFHQLLESIFMQGKKD